MPISPQSFATSTLFFFVYTKTIRKTFLTNHKVILILITRTGVFEAVFLKKLATGLQQSFYGPKYYRQKWQVVTTHFNIFHKYMSRNIAGSAISHVRAFPTSFSLLFIFVGRHLDHLFICTHFPSRSDPRITAENPPGTSEPCCLLPSVLFPEIRNGYYLEDCSMQPRKPVTAIPDIWWVSPWDPLQIFVADYSETRFRDPRKHAAKRAGNTLRAPTETRCKHPQDVLLVPSGHAASALQTHCRYQQICCGTSKNAVGSPQTFPSDWNKGKNWIYSNR